MAAMIAGEGVSGLLLNVIKIILVASIPPDETKGEEDVNSLYETIIFLTIASFLILICIVGYTYLLKIDFTKYYIFRASVKENRVSNPLSPTVVRKFEETQNLLVAAIQADDEDNITLDENTQDNKEYSEMGDEVDQNEKKLGWWELYKQVYYLSLQATLSFIVTFSIFPGTLLHTKFNMLDGNKSAIGWFTIIMVTLFSIGDTFGKVMVGIWRPLKANQLIYLTVGRVVLIPIAIFIQLSFAPSWLFQSDWFIIINMLVFSAT